MSQYNSPDHPHDAQSLSHNHLEPCMKTIVGFIFILLILGVSCNQTAMKQSAQPDLSFPPDTRMLKETSVVLFPDIPTGKDDVWHVGSGNYLEQETADGKRMSMRIVIWRDGEPEKTEIVFKGDVLTIGSGKYVIEKIVPTTEASQGFSVLRPMKDI